MQLEQIFGRNFRNGMIVSFFARLEKIHKIKILISLLSHHGKFICSFFSSNNIIFLMYINNNTHMYLKLIIGIIYSKKI